MREEENCGGLDVGDMVILKCLWSE